MQNFNLFLFSHLWILGLIIIWSLVWKGIALWKSARNGQYIWFIVLLVINTLGILEIIYIFLVAPKKKFGSNNETILSNLKRKKII